MASISEAKTREEIIDKTLYEIGWDDKFIRREPNSVQSDFKTMQLNYNRDLAKENRFIDYLLLDEYEKPLCIIEAKRFSVDPDKGIIQATTYQDDVFTQTGKRIPFMLTNGRKWYFKEFGFPTREISQPFNQDDLQRRVKLSRERKDLTKIEIAKKITDRSKSIEVSKRILEHIAKGHRKALINMATGTGKTRVAMAIIEALIRAGYVRRVLFVVDRRTLARQAKDDFDKFLSGEPKEVINEEKVFDPNKRMFISTVQTLMSKDKDCGYKFERFGSGFFDLIVYDEAHRSYYDRGNLVSKYFDALKIGLTATPSKSDEKNTYELFGCERGIPTAEYTYNEAVTDGVLVPYEAQVIGTDVSELGIKGENLNEELKTALIKQDEDPEEFEVPGSKLQKNFTDKKTNDLIVSEFMNRCYKTEDDKPCKTIFFCVNQTHAKDVMTAFSRLYPNIASEDVKVITSDKARYMDEVKRFKNNSSPRIVLSVGVLDTGVNIPEICNLVFATPVMSHIRFWQMLGRGTRSISACEHKDWLPMINGIHDKKDFRILDVKFGDFSNIIEHQLEKVDRSSVLEDVRIKNFKKGLRILEKKLSDDEINVLEGNLRTAVSKINQESFVVRDRKEMIKKIVSKKYDLSSHISELENEIAPLLKFSEYGNSKVQTFVSKCFDLFRVVKDSSLDELEELKKFICERVENIWYQDYRDIEANREILQVILQDKFWSELTFSDIDILIRKIAPLMKYYDNEKKPLIKVDAPDKIYSTKSISMQVKENPDLEYFKSTPLAQKMIKDGVNWKELFLIEEALKKMNPSFSFENVQLRQGDYVMFLRSILDLQDLPQPEMLIRKQFDDLIVGQGEYNSNQIQFLRLLEKFFIMNKHLDRKDLVSYPLSEENPLSLFGVDELDGILKRVEGIRIR